MGTRWRCRIPTSPSEPIFPFSDLPVVPGTPHLLAAALSLLITFTAAAQSAAPPAAPAQRGPVLIPVLEFALEYGGDEMAELYFTNGDTQTLTAGQGGTLALGAVVRPRPGSPLGLRGSVGYKFLLNASENADVRLTRIPIELVGTYRAPKDSWAGVGYVYHAATRLHGDGFIDDVSFGGAHGATVEAGWRYVALTYTAIGYTDEAGNDFNASNIGATVIVPLLRR